jgi:hypothetical protein
VRRSRHVFDSREIAIEERFHRDGGAKVRYTHRAVGPDGKEIRHEIAFDLQVWGCSRMKATFSSDGGAREKRASTVDQPLFGMWIDREDLSDPDLYVRKLRGSRSGLSESVRRPFELSSSFGAAMQVAKRRRQ